MKWTYKVLRSIIVILLVTVSATAVLSYVVLSIPAFQDRVRQIAESQLKNILGADVSIGYLEYTPFENLKLQDVLIPDEKGDTILFAKRLDAGISMYELLVNQRVYLDYTIMSDFEMCLSKAKPNSPLNIQFIIDKLKPKKNNPPSKLELVFNNISLRNGNFHYDLLYKPYKSDGKFDASHISVTKLSADACIPQIKGGNVEIDLNNLSLNEKSGITVTKLVAKALITKDDISLHNFALSLPSSRIQLGDISVKKTYIQSKTYIDSLNVDISIKDSYVNPVDLVAFVPDFNKLDERINIALDVKGKLDDFEISNLKLTTENNDIVLNGAFNISKILHKEDAQIICEDITASINKGSINRIFSYLSPLKPNVQKMITAAGDVSFKGNALLELNKVLAKGELRTAVGLLYTDLSLEKNENKNLSISGDFSGEQINIGNLLGIPKLGETAFNVKIEADSKQNKLDRAHVEGTLPYFQINGRNISDISLNADIKGNNCEADLIIQDENLALNVVASALLDKQNSQYNVSLILDKLNLFNLGLVNKYNGYDASLCMDVNLSGDNINNIDGTVRLSDIKFIDVENNGIELNELALGVSNTTTPKVITLSSDILNGKIEGAFDFNTLVADCKYITSSVMSALFKKAQPPINSVERDNDFTFNFTLEKNTMLSDFLHLPISFVHPITLDGSINDANNKFQVNLRAPYLMQKDKLIENTYLLITKSPRNGTVEIAGNSLIHNKKGNVSVSLYSTMANNNVDFDLHWEIDRKTDFYGDISVDAKLWRDDADALVTNVKINNTKLVFNDKSWDVKESDITIVNNRFKFDGFEVSRDQQYLKIDGAISRQTEDVAELQLLDINLDYVFQTLNISNVTLGGDATGKIFASDLFSGAPRLRTENFNVQKLSYNSVVLGDADIVSTWDNASKGITLDADVSQQNGGHSFVHGAIFPTRDSLNLNFKADRINVGFIQPFMAVFSSEVSGEASGDVTLYGKFKTLNLKGDVNAYNVGIKIDYINTKYFTSDIVHIKPGSISLKDMTIRDELGNTAKLNGELKHDYFHNPVFNFAITDAKNLLCYNISEISSPIYYGKIFGNGSAFIDGVPGKVTIDANMSTAPNSKFTFVLSDTEAASDYNFITFTDKRKAAELKAKQADLPDFIKELNANKKTDNSVPTDVRINLQVEATPDASMTLVMDPAAGDRIRAVGAGNLRIGYNTLDDEMTIYGNYTLTKGNYNFTLQDLIVKDFVIRDGSKVSFYGDPLEAVLDIKAIYSLSANLTDLDETFATDKELTRTTVPVNTILNVDGMTRQPNITFNIEFPTLTQDIDRRVRSIISTDDMMNRQIIYLLALNRFYTPDYMGNTNKNNGFANVATSTLSSQMRSLLGNLSDNWTVAPSFRSDKGDFSDVEVELALSSQLLNNRLLLNGNFGYRDKTMNTANSNFIGDFDVEYLLNKNGNFRLKAYNHFNDRNYYIKSALTTQGVGVVLKHDFSNLHNLFHRTFLPILKRDTIKVNGNSEIDTIQIKK